jgi:hypothetical protein
MREVRAAIAAARTMAMYPIVSLVTGLKEERDR